MIYYTYCHIWKLTIRLLSLFPGDISFSPSCVRNKQRTNAVVVTLFCLFCCFFPRQFQMPWCVLFANKKTFFCVVAYVSILPPQQQKKKPQQLECVLIRFNKQIVTMIYFVETKVESIQRQNGSCGRRLAQQLTTEVKTPSLMTEIDGRLCRKKKLVYAHFRTDKSGKDVLPEEDATAVKFRSVSMVCVLVCVYIPSESRDTHKICRSSLEKVRLIEFPIEGGRFLLIISKIGRIPISQNY